MKVLSLEILCFEKCLIYQKATQKQNLRTLYFRVVFKKRGKYNSSKN